jgi:pantoate--beta-alanine ligase
MEVFESKTQARAWVVQQRLAGRSVGMVPTMGALHEGHFSLVRQSVASCDATVATIFVNPIQFAANEDLSRYPRTLEQDLDGLRASGAAAVFVPETGSMYRDGHSTFVQPPQVAMSLEGAVRPEHFRGVTTVVLKLMQILPTTDAFFGQKDYQQAAVIMAMVADLDVDMQIHVCPIMRDADGLALSSRNRYLSADERARALAIPRALAEAQRLIAVGERDVAVIESRMVNSLKEGGVTEVDYAVVADGVSLEGMGMVVPGCVALVAARVGSTRLIDNWIWKG